MLQNYGNGLCLKHSYLFFEIRSPKIFPKLPKLLIRIIEISPLSPKQLFTAPNMHIQAEVNLINFDIFI